MMGRPTRPLKRAIPIPPPPMERLANPPPPPPPKPPPPKPRASADCEASTATASVAAEARVRIVLRDMVVLRGFEFQYPWDRRVGERFMRIFRPAKSTRFLAGRRWVRAKRAKNPRNARQNAW